MQWLRLIKAFFTDTNRRKWFWPVVSFLALILLVGSSFLPAQVDVNVGEVAREDIEAPNNMVLIDEERTDQLREEMAQQVPNVIEEDPEAIDRTRGDLNFFFNFFRREDNIFPNGSFRWEGLSTGQFGFWTNVSSERRSFLQEKLEGILVEEMEGGIRSTHLDEAKENVTARIAELDITEQEKEQLVLLGERFIRPNLVLNVEETARRREEARQGVTPVTRAIRQGEVLIRQGQVITEEDIELL